MVARKLREAFERAERRPEAAQLELAELALEIDASLRTSSFAATPTELAGIDRGRKDADEGRFAADAKIEGLFEKFRPR